MNFPHKIGPFMKPFISSFGKCPTPKLNKQDKNIYNEILISLYRDIYDAHNHVFNQACFKSNIVSIHAKDGTLKRPDIYNDRYFPAHIQKYIKENEQAQLIFSCKNVGNREINIIFSLFVETVAENNIEKYVAYANAMYMWLYICAKYATKNCSETLDIYLYQTPFTKNLPANMTTILGPEQVNTAFTYACVPRGQMIIYRDEEWFKVFIHETFHSYGLDFGNEDGTELKSQMYDLFPIQSDFEMHEAYTETWARLINCALCSFNILPNKKNKQAFVENITVCIELERMFAIYQCNKILGFMGLEYQDIHHANTEVANNTLYRENTHVFAYYVMTSIFLNDYQGFLVWCKKHNKSLLKFERTPMNFNAFAEYIKTIYSCDTFKQNMTHMNNLYKRQKSKKNVLETTSRMSVVHTLG